jgi:hypothetical protein
MDGEGVPESDEARREVELTNGQWSSPRRKGFASGSDWRQIYTEILAMEEKVLTRIGQLMDIYR